MDSRLRIGIVEDSREDYLALARILGPDVLVEHWQTAEQALPALSYGQLDGLALVIVDGHLPGMEGADLVQAIRDTTHGKRARVVVLSGSSDPHSVRRALAAGADRYVEKGTTLQDLKRAVSECVESVVGSSEPGR